MTGLLTVLFLWLLTAGCCGPAGDPGPPRLEDVAGGGEVLEPDGAVELEETGEVVVEGESDPFGDQKKLREIRDLFEQERYAYLIPLAESMLGRPELDVPSRLELAFLLTDAYRKLGEAGNATRMQRKFDELREEYGKSDAATAEQQTRSTVQQFAAELRKKRLHFLPPELRERQSERLVAALERVGDGEVAEVEAPDGAVIYCSRDARSLEEKMGQVISGDAAPVLHHDLEFDFYFSIDEPPPPSDVR